MTVAAFVLAIVALLFAVGAELAKRPELDIRPARWAQSGEVSHDFLVVRVFNRPLPAWINWLFTRNGADGCEISLTFSPEGDPLPVIDQMAGRWSRAPEPLNWQRTPPIPDAGRVQDSNRWDVAAGDVGEEMAVARTSDGAAYAFSAESYLYMHQDWRRPGWELGPGRWLVVLRGGPSGVAVSRTLSFEVSDTGALRWLEAPAQD